MPSAETQVLYEALASPLGIVVKTNDTDLAKARLYKARRESGDPELDVLQIRTSPFNSDELWIVKSKPKSETPSAPL